MSYCAKYVLAVLTKAFPNREPGITDSEFIQAKSLEYIDLEIPTKSRLEFPKGVSKLIAQRDVRMSILTRTYISVENGMPPRKWKEHINHVRHQFPEMPSNQELRAGNRKNRKIRAALQRELVEAEGPFEFVIGVPPEVLRQMQEERLERMFLQSPHTPSFGQGCD